MEAALRKFRERDRECQRARAELFAAFQTWMEGHSKPPKAAKNWWRLMEDRREELRHTADWTAARAETRRQKALEEEAARKHAKEEEARRRAEARAELERVRAQRLAHERALRETHARLEAVRRLEERLAGTLGEVDGPASSTPGWESQSPPPRLWYCPICGRPGVREVRRCPDGQHHPPKPQKR